MSLDLLDTPLRLTWDFPCRDSGLHDSDLLRIADRIVDAGLFFVSLEGAPLRAPACIPLLDRLLAGGCQVRLVCNGSEEELSGLGRLTDRPVELLLEVGTRLGNTDGHMDASALDATLEQMRRAGAEPGLTLTPLRANLGTLAALLRFCQARQVKRLRLPNANIGARFECYRPDDLPRWSDLEAFAAAWRRETFAVSDWPTLEIHDLFLWEILAPDNRQARAEYGGCQAGNSLGHVDADGLLHPCAAWPAPLGALLDAPLEQLWRSPQRLTTRRQVATTPAGCQGCRDLPICFGGCRGLALHLNQANGERDLMCRAPRRN
ncbi:MAG: SPASM domain-containing protein [Desulfuromonadales bacterium]|nr:SPASM domain-containing protein [Desulfuromonadales bacterium]